MESLRKSKYIGLRIHSNFLKDNRSSSTAFNPTRVVLKYHVQIHVAFVADYKTILQATA